MFTVDVFCLLVSGDVVHTSGTCDAKNSRHYKLQPGTTPKKCKSKARTDNRQKNGNTCQLCGKGKTMFSPVLEVPRFKMVTTTRKMCVVGSSENSRACLHNAWPPSALCSVPPRKRANPFTRRVLLATLRTRMNGYGLLQELQQVVQCLYSSWLLRPKMAAPFQNDHVAHITYDRCFSVQTDCMLAADKHPMLFSRSLEVGSRTKTDNFWL